MGALDRYLGAMALVSRAALWLGGAALLASALLIGVEVVLRKVFLVTIGGSDEIAGYAFAAGTTLALAGTLLERGHVRVDALYVHFPTKLRAALDLLALVGIVGFVALLMVRGLAVLQDSILFSARATTPLATPLVIPQSVWLAGFVLFLLVSIPLAARVALALASRDLATVQRLAGARSIEEDAVAEVESATGQSAPRSSQP